MNTENLKEEEQEEKVVNNKDNVDESVRKNEDEIRVQKEDTKSKGKEWSGTKCLVLRKEIKTSNNKIFNKDEMPTHKLEENGEW